MVDSVASKCDGINDSLKECTQYLRSCLKDVFPLSKSIEFENDERQLFPFFRILFGKQINEM